MHAAATHKNAYVIKPAPRPASGKSHLMGLAAGAARPIAIFDVCGTLYRENTTRGFLTYYHQRHASRAYSHTEWMWTSTFSPAFYLGAVAYRWLGRDLARQMLLRSLAGVPRATIEQAARDYVASVLPAKRIEPLHAKLREHCEAGDRVVLVSNSIDVVIEPIARALGVEWRSSQIGFEDDTCTGRLRTDLTGRKSVELARLDPYRESALLVYTDNRSDMDLVHEADFATIILPPNGSKSAWRTDRIEFMEA